MKPLGKIDELSKNFLQFEQDLGLFQETVDEVYFWERIRFGVFNYLYERTAGEKQKQTLFRARKKRLSFYFSSVSNILKNPFLTSKKDVLFVGSPRRVLYHDGTWWDLYTDPIINHLEESYISLEPDFRLQHSKPAHTKNLKHLDFIVFLNDLQRKLRISRVTFSKKDNLLIESIQNEIQRRFGIKYNTRKMIVASLEQRKGMIPVYLRLLKLISPRIIIVAVSYGKEDLIEAAKSLNIPVAELQHGVIYPMHFGYSFPGPNATKLTFPDYLLVFGDFWAEVADYPIGKDRIVSVGYPYMEIEKEKLVQVKSKNKILIISQGGLGNSISSFAVELSQLVGEKYEILYKLHPREIEGWQKRYSELIDANLTVIDTMDTSLYQLFSESCIQVGVSSTAIYEGLAFGLQTYLIDAPSVEFFNNLTEAGFAYKIKTPQELVERMNMPKTSGFFDSEKIFKSNAVENILSFIQKFITNR